MNEKNSDDQIEDPNQSLIRRYNAWLFSGSLITVALKFSWTGIWLTALTTFQFKKALAIIISGIIIWFIVNDYENWYIEY